VKKILLLGIALLVPAFLFLNAWQGYRYHVLSQEVASIEERQKSLLEGNIDVLSRIAFERSPLRIEERAASVPGLARVDSALATRVVVGGARQP
jgi:hypothetical protein